MVGVFCVLFELVFILCSFMHINTSTVQCQSTLYKVHPPHPANDRYGFPDPTLMASTGMVPTLLTGMVPHPHLLTGMVPHHPADWYGTKWWWHAVIMAPTPTHWHAVVAWHGGPPQPQAHSPLGLWSGGRPHPTWLLQLDLCPIPTWIGHCPDILKSHTQLNVAMQCGVLPSDC